MNGRSMVLRNGDIGYYIFEHTHSHIYTFGLFWIWGEDVINELSQGQNEFENGGSIF